MRTAMRQKQIFPGVEEELKKGMTPPGNVVRDAWVFGLLPETETCKGWTQQRLLALYDQVSEAWQPYGHLVSKLPPELRERHERIYSAAIAEARRLGWDPDRDLGAG